MAYKRYVVQGMTHPSLSIVEKDNAVSISFVIIYRHTSPLRYEREEVTYGRFCHIFNSPCRCFAARSRGSPIFFFSERPVDIGINIAVLTISDIEEENMVSQAPFAWFMNGCVLAVT